VQISQDFDESHERRLFYKKKKKIDRLFEIIHLLRNFTIMNLKIGTFSLFCVVTNLPSFKANGFITKQSYILESNDQK